ncbi:MAG: hypothetical protein WC333_10180, partial [Dehalococcoidia bacterium]
MEKHETSVSRFFALNKDGLRKIGKATMWTLLIVNAVVFISTLWKKKYVEQSEGENRPGWGSIPTPPPSKMTSGHNIAWLVTRNVLNGVTIFFTFYFLALFNLSFYQFLALGLTIPLFCYLTSTFIMLFISRILTITPPKTLPEVGDDFTGDRRIALVYPFYTKSDDDIDSLFDDIHTVFDGHVGDPNIKIIIEFQTHTSREAALLSRISDGLRDIVREYGAGRVYVFLRHSQVVKPMVYQNLIRWLRWGEIGPDPTGEMFFKGILTGEEGELARRNKVIKQIAAADSKDEIRRLIKEELLKSGDPIKNITSGISSVPYLFVSDFGDLPAQGTLTKLSKKMAHPANKDYILFQPRMKFRNGDDTLWTAMKALMQIIMWFCQEGLFKIFGRAQPFGKFGIKVDLYDTHMLQSGLWANLDQDINYVESHDYMEGSYMNTALCNDCDWLESAPANPIREDRREGKWRSFDIQNVTKFFYVFPVIPLLTIAVTLALSGFAYILRRHDTETRLREYSKKVWLNIKLLPNAASARWTAQIMRGLVSDLFFSVFLIIGWYGVMFPGVQEMRFQLGGEWLSIVVMTLLIIVPAYISALVNRIRDGGEKWYESRILAPFVWLAIDVPLITGEKVFTTLIFLNKLFLSFKTQKYGIGRAYARRLAHLKKEAPHLAIGAPPWEPAGVEGPNYPLRLYMLDYKVPFTFAVSLGMLFILGLFNVGATAGLIIGVCVGTLTVVFTHIIPILTLTKQQGAEPHSVVGTVVWGVLAFCALATLGIFSASMSPYVPFHWLIRFMPLYLAFLGGPYASWFVGEAWSGKKAKIILGLVGVSSVIVGVTVFGGVTGLMPIAGATFGGDSLGPAALPIMLNTKALSFSYHLGLPLFFTLLHTTIAGGMVVVTTVSLAWALFKSIPALPGVIKGFFAFVYKAASWVIRELKLPRP